MIVDEDNCLLLNRADLSELAEPFSPADDSQAGDPAAEPGAGFVVRKNRLGKGVYARAPIAGGSLVAGIEGRRAPKRTRMTVQTDWDAHVEIDSPWQYVNHACDPNCQLVIRRGSERIEIRAIRDLARGEELTLDYDLFEYEIGHFPARCLCGSANCRGLVRGYKFLPAEARKARARFAADYLLDGR